MAHSTTHSTAHTHTHTLHVYWSQIGNMIVDYCGHGDNRIFGGQRVVQRVLLGGGILLLQNSELCSVRPAARGVEEGREERPRFRFTRFSRYPRRDPQSAIRCPQSAIHDPRSTTVACQSKTSNWFLAQRYATIRNSAETEAEAETMAMAGRPEEREHTEESRGRKLKLKQSLRYKFVRVPPVRVRIRIRMRVRMPNASDKRRSRVSVSALGFERIWSSYTAEEWRREPESAESKEFQEKLCL